MLLQNGERGLEHKHFIKVEDRAARQQMWKSLEAWYTCRHVTELLFLLIFTNILTISVSTVPNFSAHYLSGIFVNDTLYFLREHSFPIVFLTLFPLQEFVARPKSPLSQSWTRAHMKTNDHANPNPYFQSKYIQVTIIFQIRCGQSFLKEWYTVQSHSQLSTCEHKSTRDEIAKTEQR